VNVRLIDLHFGAIFVQILKSSLY